jgi:hypothetical protein
MPVFVRFVCDFVALAAQVLGMKKSSPLASDAKGELG